MQPNEKLLSSPKLYFEVARIYRLILNGLSISRLNLEHIPSQQIPLANHFIYEVIRWHHRMSWQLEQVASSDVNKWDPLVRCLINLGICLLQQSDKPDYAVVNNCVEATKLIPRSHAGGLTNGCLRNFIRSKDLRKASLMPEEALFSHPKWLIDLFKSEFPDKWKNICEGNNERAPLFLRVNTKNINVHDYMHLLDNAKILYEPDSVNGPMIMLTKPLSKKTLPGYADGLVSIQDASSQLVVNALDIKKNDRVLDMCASPGGKTSYLLEREDIDLLALEVDERRKQELDKNLERLKLICKTLHIDAREVITWKGSQHFDHILLDAPCSGIGVVRRYPDIKIHRRREDIMSSCEIQRELMCSGWQVLKKGGTLVYSVCTITKTETIDLVLDFLESQPDASLIETKLILPSESGMNGFYYAKLGKR